MAREIDACDALSEGGSPEADRRLAENFGMTVKQVREFDPQTLDVTRACKFLGLPPRRFDSLATQPDARGRWVGSVAQQRKDLIETFPDASKDMKEMLEAIRKFALRKCLKPDGPAMMDGTGRGATKSKQTPKGQALLLGGGVLAVVVLVVVAVLILSAKSDPDSQGPGFAGSDGRQAPSLLPPTVPGAVPVVGKSGDRPAPVEGKVEGPEVKAPKPPTNPGTEVLLDVDFTNTTSNFRLSDQHHVCVEHKDGELRYVGKKTGLWFDWLHTAFDPKNKVNTLENFGFEADVRIPEPVQGSLVFRFGIHGDSYQALSLRQDGRVAVWSSGREPLWTKPEGMRPVTEFNTLHLEVVNGKVRLQVNEQQVVETVATRYVPSHGMLWLYPDAVPFEVRFRRIKLWKLPAQPPSESDPPRKVAADEELFQGRWLCVREQSLGKDWPRDEVKAFNKRVEVKGDQFMVSQTIQGQFALYSGQFRLTSNVHPKEFDWHGTGPNGVALRIVGVYEVTADRLRLCFRTVLAGAAVARPGWADALADSVVCMEFEPNRRHRWEYDRGTFVNVLGTKWVESVKNGNQALEFHFEEVRRESSYIELRDKSRDCSVKIFDGEYQVKFGSGAFETYHQGKWRE